MSTLCELFKHVEKFDNFICLENILSTFTLTHIWLTQAGHKHRVSSTYNIKIRMNLTLAKIQGKGLKQNLNKVKL